MSQRESGESGRSSDGAITRRMPDHALREVLDLAEAGPPRHYWEFRLACAAENARRQARLHS